MPECSYLHEVRWTDEATARHVATDLTRNDGSGVWVAVHCPGEPNASYPEYGPHWHAVQESRATPTTR